MGRSVRKTSEHPEQSAATFLDQLSPSGNSRVASDQSEVERLEARVDKLVAALRLIIVDIFQSLFNLSDKIVAFEFPLTVPANLTSNENVPALRNDAVGITFRSRPILRLHGFKRAFAHETCSRSLNR